MIIFGDIAFDRSRLLRVIEQRDGGCLLFLESGHIPFTLHVKGTLVEVLAWIERQESHNRQHELGR